MATKQIQFKRPVTLRNEEGKEETFGKGVHPVDAGFCQGWFYEGLKKEGGIVVLDEGEAKVEEPNGNGDEGGNLLDGNVKEVVAKIEAADLGPEDLAALAEHEAAGKNRKGVLDAIAKKGE